MSQRNRRRKSGPSGTNQEVMFIWAGIGLVAAIVACTWLPLHLSERLFGGGQNLPGDPFGLMLGLTNGTVTWTGAATGVLLGLLAIVATVTGAITWWTRRGSSGRTRVDASATYMGRGTDLDALTEKGATETAKRLGVTDSPGVPIGRTVAGRQMLYGSWEDMHVDIWGPRTGKTTSRAIPAIMAAPGAVLVTSNKRDIVDATRGPRAKKGPVWVFDPQQIALEEPDWFWNPLSYVTDEVKAAQLAGHFAAGSRDESARSDAYFDGEGRNLLANLFLAAALDGRPITGVYTWLSRPTDDTAVHILSEHGFPLQADGLSGIIEAPDKQRAGVFGTAMQMATCLTNRRIAPWVTRTGPDDHRPHFDPHTFVQGQSALYSLSKEGAGTAGPLVTALTVAVVEAAEELATTQKGGRLRTPMLGVLDEVANVCKWAELPAMYSHYGSRGIVLMAILQSWSQGVEVWGEKGMAKLWSASNVKVYGGGVSETAFLQELSSLIGDYDREAVSASVSRDGRSTSHQLTSQSTMDVADLAAIPRGRAVVVASGAPPTLIETVPWMKGPHAQDISDSITTYEPGGAP